MLTNAKNNIKKVVNKKNIDKLVKIMSSPTAVNGVKLAVAIITLFQAIDAVKDSKRRIGFIPPSEDLS